jgi:hypothetical protein
VGDMCEGQVWIHVNKCRLSRYIGILPSPWEKHLPAIDLSAALGLLAISVWEAIVLTESIEDPIL